MKTLAKQLSILLIIPFLLFSCEKDDSKETPDNKTEKDYSAYVKLTSNQAKDVNIHKAILRASLDSINNVKDYSMGFLLFYGSKKSEPLKIELENTMGTFELSLDTLKPNTSYYFAPYVAVKSLYNKDSVCCGDTNEFKTFSKVFTKIYNNNKDIFFSGDTVYIYNGPFSTDNNRVYFIYKDKEYDLDILNVSKGRIDCRIPNFEDPVLTTKRLFIESGDLNDYLDLKGRKDDIVILREYIDKKDGKWIESKSANTFISGRFGFLHADTIMEQGQERLRIHYRINIGGEIIDHFHKELLWAEGQRIITSIYMIPIPKDIPLGTYQVKVTSHSGRELIAPDSVTIIE